MTRKRTYSPRGKSKRCLALTGLLGWVTPAMLCYAIWNNQERTTLDTLKRLIDQGFLAEAYEKRQFGAGRPDRILFLTWTGMRYLVDHGFLPKPDIHYFWRGEGHEKPSYRRHEIEIRRVLITFITHLRNDPHGAIWLKSKSIRAEPSDTGNDTSPLQSGQLLPDAVFAVRDGQSGQIKECYAELDLATENHEIWGSKISRYRQSPEVMDSAANVLVVASDEERMHQLMSWSQNTSPFLFSTLDKVCFSYQRDGKKLRLISPGDPLGKVWQHCNDTRPRCLFAPL